MFLLKRKTELVLLMTIFGMLLSSVHIQPAQALMCYGCPETDTEEYWKCVDSDAALTTKITCPEGDMSCYEMEIRYLNTSVMDPIPRISRGCVDLRELNSSLISCEEFKPWPFTPELGPSVNKMCICQTDLCNQEFGQKEKVKESEKKSASIRIRSLGQLLIFCIIVAVSASWN